MFCTIKDLGLDPDLDWIQIYQQSGTEPNTAFLNHLLTLREMR